MITTDREKLKIKCRETTLEECKQLDIFSTLDRELQNNLTPGIGLSANQIGFDIRACIIRMKDLKLNMINPVIEDSDRLIVNPNEGCMSFPGLRVNTNRYYQVRVSWLDFDTERLTQAVFYADSPNRNENIVVQHELDHLDGLTILDRVAQPIVKVGRNDPCPCGSGKKYKKCCLK